MTVEIGDEAPDFELVNQAREKVRLSSFRGKKNVVLIFYPFAFSGLCTGELCEVRDSRADFVADDVVTLGISCDSFETIRAFAAQQDLNYDLLSDFWPHGQTAIAYGSFFEPAGMAARGTFIIDKDGIIRWMVVNGPGEVRSIDDYRAALAALT